MKKSTSKAKDRFWVGMDDHAATIAVAVLKNDEAKPAATFTVSNDQRGHKQLIKRLRELEGEVQCVYEAGPCGYGLQRGLAKAKIHCDVAAPSLTPRRPGRRVKTDRRDALKLAEMLRGKVLVMVTIPDLEREALRDLVRAREDAGEDLLRARNRLSRFLLRHEQQYRAGDRWTRAHWQWIRSLKLEQKYAQQTLDEYITVTEGRKDRMDALTQVLKTVAEEHHAVISRYCVLRGVDWLTALTVYAEFGDLRRYTKAPGFMAAIGLVPTEDSSGPNQRRGAITKTGNAHVRRVLVESAWHARHAPSRAGERLRKRRQNLPAEVVRIAERAEVRLHRKFSRMIYRNKRSTVAAVAVARELCGFLWAIAQLP
jgi:transposase